MVIGNGLVATGFSMHKHNDQVIMFGSGVSNSNNTDAAAFEREANLLNNTIAQLQTKLLIYISTCSIYDPSMQLSPYVLHKLAMEKIVKEKSANYYIFRVPNLAGKTSNPHTILNYFFQKIITGKPFDIWQHAHRNIIDIEDAVQICNYYINNSFTACKTVNVANTNTFSVLEIVSQIEKAVGKKGQYNLIEKGNTPAIDTSEIEPVLKKLGIRFTDNYLQKIIKKYLIQNDL